ncbi:30S ribosomal protein S3 [Ktedonospora formicarum]|uniref:Small ribosomal subunit protein uS3 n=1 Tax=Ktedonospora formicarum TaxID=2778364 RepID=A0A8J3MT76_9CHLR|nr:hypothetical protein KSX_22230 [Ktedonospora formicarum]
MGHKVNPIGFRLGVLKGWDSWQSRWYAEQNYKDILAEDIQIRRLITKELSSSAGARVDAAISKIEIERAAPKQVLVKVNTAKPGIVIGKSGEKVERLKTALEAKTQKRVRIEIIEIRQPELDAYLVARSIADQLEKRVSFRRAMKQAVQKSMRANAKGIKIIVGGRLGGAEIARSEKEVEGKVPLHTLRADIDYGLAEARTTFGVIGVKVWIYRGDILPSRRREGLEAEPFAPTTPREQGDRRPDRRRGEGGPRGQRPSGDRTRGGERPPRGPRPQGERGPRPQGDRPQGDRPQRQRPPRAQGERGPRPQGERQQPAIEETKQQAQAPTQTNAPAENKPQTGSTEATQSE